MDSIWDQAQPKYRMVKERIVDSISSGEFSDGSFLPSEKSLTELFSVGRNTVRKALEELRNEKVIITNKGQKSIINKSALVRPNRFTRIAWLSRNPIAEIETVYFQIYSAFLKAAEKNSINVIFISIQDEQDSDWFVNHVNEIDGIILAGVSAGHLDDHMHKKLRAINNTVEIDDINNSPARGIVCADNYYGACLGTEFLIAKNLKNTAFVTRLNSGKYKPFYERQNGYDQTMEKNGLTPLHLLTSPDPHKDYEILKHLKKFLSRHKVDAFFALTDKLAISLLYALQALGYKVPQDISVMGFDGTTLSQTAHPPLTTVAQPTTQIGRKAFKMLQNMADKRKIENITLRPQILTGATVKTKS